MVDLSVGLTVGMTVSLTVYLTVGSTAVMMDGKSVYWVWTWVDSLEGIINMALTLEYLKAK